MRYTRWCRRLLQNLSLNPYTELTNAQERSNPRDTVFSEAQGSQLHQQQSVIHQVKGLLEVVKAHIDVITVLKQLSYLVQEAKQVGESRSLVYESMLCIGQNAVGHHMLVHGLSD